MNWINFLNSALLAAALVTSATLTGALTVWSPAPEALLVEPERQTSVEDVNNVRVPVNAYSRIVSASTIADQILIRLIEPSRILAVSDHTLRGGDEPWRYEGKLGVGSAQDIESIIQLRPDLVFVNNFVDVRHVQRMKEAGLTVFDLGPMRGMETLMPNIHQVSSLLGVPERGQALAREFERRLNAVAADIPPSARRRGLYVGIHGDRLYGGTARTSFHDVLQAAGLIDVAAEAGYEGWPAFTSEELLTLNPQWIITNKGREDAFCRHAGFDALVACQASQVRGIDTDLLSDPGLGILEAAEAVRDAVYDSGAYRVQLRKDPEH